MRSSVAAGDRSKHAHGPCTMTRRDFHDVVAATTERFETGRRSDRKGVRIRAAAPLDLPTELTQPAKRLVLAFIGHSHESQSEEPPVGYSRSHHPNVRALAVPPGPQVVMHSPMHDPPPYPEAPTA